MAITYTRTHYFSVVCDSSKKGKFDVFFAFVFGNCTHLKNCPQWFKFTPMLLQITPNFVNFQFYASFSKTNVQIE